MFMMNEYYDKNYVFPKKKTTQLNLKQSKNGDVFSSVSYR